MKSVFFLFSHPAPYKVNLFNGLAKSLDLTVFFERTLGKYAQQQYIPTSQWQFRYRMLKGIKLGKENHLSFEVIQHFKHHRYDAIVMNGYASLTEMVTILFLQRMKIPYYLYVNGGVIRQDPWWRFILKKRLISKAKGYLSPSPLVDPYLVHYGAKREAIFHYPYATIFANEVLPTPLTKQEKLSLRKTIGLPLEGDILLAVGQFIPRKNFFPLLKAWEKIPKDRNLVLIGDGKEKRRYERWMQTHHLTHVILKPFQPKNLLLSMLRASDGFILLSKEDIYGHVINEALSQGIPVLTSDKVVSGQVLIKPEKNGLILPLLALDHLPKAVHTLLQIKNPEASLQIARENTIEQMVKAHLEFFQHG